jgi:hypothetical protein
VGLLFGLILVVAMVVMIWYGFNLVRKPTAAEASVPPAASCHLCRRTFPVDQMVSRDKMAGFINYFCGDCIRALHDDYAALRERGLTPDVDRISRN